MSETTIYLSMGANLGEPKAQIERGIIELNEQDVVVTGRSSWYETEPVGVADQPWFTNLVLRAETSRSPQDLLKVCKSIETHVGRQPSVRFGPRHLDIDILLYGDRIVDTEDLTIPHPRMRERRFVLVPLLEIAPGLTDPVSHESYAEVLSRLDEGKKVLRSPINES